MVYIRCPPSEKGFLEKNELPFESIADSLYLNYLEARKLSYNDKLVGFLEKHAQFDNLIFQDTMEELRRVGSSDIPSTQRDIRALGENKAEARDAASHEAVRW